MNARVRLSKVSLSLVRSDARLRCGVASVVWAFCSGQRSAREASG
jgi:hypothetical protein